MIPTIDVPLYRKQLVQNKDIWIAIAHPDQTDLQFTWIWIETRLTHLWCDFVKLTAALPYQKQMSNSFLLWNVYNMTNI